MPITLSCGSWFKNFKSHNQCKWLPQSFWSEWKQNAKQLSSAAWASVHVVCTQDVCHWYDRDCSSSTLSVWLLWPNETLCVSESLCCWRYTSSFLFYPPTLKNCSVWEVFQTNGPMFITVQKCRPNTWLLWLNFRCLKAIFSFGDRLFSV